jgi:hypothetical protein
MNISFGLGKKIKNLSKMSKIGLRDGFKKVEETCVFWIEIEIEETLQKNRI